MKTVVFVLGAARSGTTMLDAMIGNSGDAFSCGEVRNLYRPTRTQHFSPDCVCGQNPCDVWEKLRLSKEHNFHESVFLNRNADFVVDSSKVLDWLIDSRATIPDSIRVRCVVIWKDPIRNAYSYWKRGASAQDWERPFVSYYKRLLDLRLPFVSVRYDEFVRSPGEKLAKICKKIDMPYYEGMEKFWLKDHHFLFGSHGVRQQVAAKRSIVYQDEPYPKEFIGMISQLGQRTRDNTDLANILRNLEAFDVDNEGLVAWGDFQGMAIKPGWYYLAKARDKVRKHLPQEYTIRDVNPLYGKEAVTRIEIK